LQNKLNEENLIQNRFNQKSQSYTKKKVKILLVDDEPFNHMALKNMIKVNLKDSVELESAFNGKDGYDKLYSVLNSK
jgi:PleD family two-component response regulator